MQSLKQTINSQDGAVLIIVMLVLIAVTAVGLTAMNISTTEVNLAGNDKWQKTGLYNADPGLHGTPSVIYPNLNPETMAPLPAANPGDPNDEGCLEYINTLTASDFHDILYSAKTDPLPVADINKFDNKDISFRNCGVAADIDVTPRGSQQLSGGGVEFASRSEGTGVSGSEAKLYMITSTGDGAGNSNYTVRGHYRWTELGGGLK
ncbi:MAG: pilus assembly PilX N-terminal domain-containing protein [Desulfobacteraceae bacterium]|jgi:Tfp pilus assembly protein PilX